MRKAALLATLLAAVMHVALAADSRPQAGPNNNVVSGVLTTIPADKNLAAIKTDLNNQRQNEPVIAASTRNPDHLLAAANDYRTVVINSDTGIGEADNSFIARLIARLLGRPRSTPPRAATAAEAWLGVYRSCDRGRTWIGSLLPGSPNDSSPASMASPLKGLDATTDAVMASLPGGRIVVGGGAFTRNGPSKIFAALYEDKNNHEGGTCFHYVPKSTKVIASASNATNGQFNDKPAIAADTRNGTDYVYLSYTVFEGVQRDGRIRTKLMIARSANGGLTWTSVDPKISRTFLRNQGSAIAVDPLNGDVYVVWRLFYDNAMMVVKSKDRGLTWTSPVNINYTPLAAFDQGTGVAPDYGFRTNAFPTITAAVVKNPIDDSLSTKLFVAWQERVDVGTGEPNAVGTPRIVLTMSTNGGASWSMTRKAIDLGNRSEWDVSAPAESDDPAPSMPAIPVPPGQPTGFRPSGPQVMPSLSSSGGRVMLLYYEARWLPSGAELGGPPPGFITGIERQMDARIAEIDPTTGTLLGESAQVSQYSIAPGSAQSPPEFVETALGYSAVNRPNLPMYRGGTAAFVGDYITLAPAIPFVTGSPWHWPTAEDVPSPSFHAVFNDNRMVGYPGDNIYGDWIPYQPAGSPGCVNPLSRNADIFHSEISGAGLIAGSPQTFKQLGFVTGMSGLLMPRAFVMYVANRTDASMRVRLTVEDNDGTPPTYPSPTAPAVDASLKQFDLDPGPFNDVEQKDFEILPHSSVTRTVFAQSEVATASFRVRVEELDLMNNVKQTTFVTFNPDPGNPLLETPTDPDDPNPAVKPIDKNETHTPQIDTPQIDTTHQDKAYNPQIDTPQIDTSGTQTPQIDTPQIDTPQIDTAQLVSGDLTDSADGKIDVVWRVKNNGNTTSMFNTFMNVPNADALIAAGWQFQVIIAVNTYIPGVTGVAGCDNAALVQTRVVSNIPITTTTNPQIDTPQIDTANPQIDTPQIDTSQISNASFALAPLSGIEGQNSHGEDLHGPVLAEEGVILLRGIKREGTPAASDDDPGWPQEAALLVKAGAANVIEGVTDTDLPSAFSGPDLAITSGAPTLSPALVVANDTVTVSGGTIENLGDVATPPFNVGHLISTDTIISATDPALSIQPFNNNVGLAKSGSPGSSATFAATDVVIPFNTSVGSYHLGILADYSGAVTETNRANNVVSKPIDVVPSPSIVTASPLPSATFNSSYSTPITGQDGIPPYSWSVAGGSLPPGLTLNPSTGVISGTPTAVGAFTVTLQLTDSAAATQSLNVANHVAQKIFTLQVNGPTVTALDTDFVAVGVGAMRGVGSGTITVSGVSGTVTQALLYWHGPTNSSDPLANATVTFNENTVTGTNIGFADDNNWSVANSQAYRADVTSLVTDNGSYSLSSFRKVGPPVADINGVSLIVFFDDGNDANNRDVYLLDVNDSNEASTFEGGGATGWNQTIAGINYSSGTAFLELHVADGQKGASAPPARQWEDGALVINGTTIASQGHIFSGDSVQGGTSNPEPNSTGGLWDIKPFDITSRLSAGSNTLTLTSPFLDDRLSVVVVLVSVPHTGGS